jgi:hypothetical protein
MSVFDVNNPPPQPDSDLDPDLNLEQTFQVADGKTVDIAPGDFVDVMAGVLSPDPEWGLSYQCSNVYPNAVGILVMTDPVEQQYTECQLSPEVITNNWRRMPTT